MLILSSGFIITDTYSQGTDLRKTGKSFFIGLSLIPAQTRLFHSGTTLFTGIESTGDFAFSGSIDAGYFFSKHFGVASGIGYKSFRNELTLAQYQSNFQGTDTDSESFEMRVTGSGIKEEITLGFVSIPVKLIVRIPAGDKLGFLIQPGIDINIPAGNEYKNSGKFTYKGYYAAYNVLLEDLPDYGFPTNLSSSSEGSIETNSLCINALISVGIDFSLSDHIKIALAGIYDKSLSNVSGYSSTDKFQLSEKADELNSLMGGFTKSSTSAFGLSLTLRYYLK